MTLDEAENLAAYIVQGAVSIEQADSLDEESYQVVVDSPGPNGRVVLTDPDEKKAPGWLFQWK